MRLRAVIAILFVLMPLLLNAQQERLPWTDPFPETTGQAMTAEFRFYDIGGRYGMNVLQDGISLPQGTFSGRFFVGDEIYPWEVGRLGESYDVDGHPRFAPYYFESRSTIFGCLAGGWWLDLYTQPTLGNWRPPRWVIPVDGDVVGMTHFMPDISYDYEQEDKIFLLIIEPFIADSKTTASLAYKYRELPLAGWPGTAQVTVEYLQGNVLYGRQMDSVNINLSPNENDSVHIKWGSAPYSYQPIDHVFDPSNVPVGPLKVTFSIRGYESDSMLVSAKNQHGLNWQALLVPSSADARGPSDLLWNELLLDMIEPHLNPPPFCCSDCTRMGPLLPPDPPESTNWVFH